MPSRYNIDRASRTRAMLRDRIAEIKQDQAALIDRAKTIRVTMLRIQGMTAPDVAPPGAHPDDGD